MKQRNNESIHSDLESRIADLSPAKRALLQQRLKIQGTGSLLEQAIPRQTQGQSAPLSFAQQRLWFLDQYEPNSSFYNVVSALRLQGRLDVATLQRSLNEIVRRHEALRTTFSAADGEPAQITTPPADRALALIDLGELSEREREGEARRLAGDEAQRPFDLTRGPLFRPTLIRLSPDDHILVLTLHHIVSDGWSMGILRGELSALYKTFCDGKRSPLPDLPIQYADFAIWQRKWLQGEALESQLSYWKKQLEGIPAVLNLPTDYPRPAVQAYRGARRSMELSEELSGKLRALSRKEGVTLFMTLLAAFQTLLYRYTGQEDIVVGSPIANRNRTEIEGLIGFFVNTLVLRSDFSDNPSFKKLLARVREMTLGAYAHQDLPFEKLVEELRPERSLSHSPLFQVMFVLQNASSTALTFEGLSASPLRIARETGKFDLTLSMSETSEGLRGSLQYSTDLFDDGTIGRVIGHLETLLEGIVANPDRRVCDLPLLTAAEKHELFVEWNDTQKDYPREKCLHQLFEEQVERSPGATAVIFEDRQLTYRELNTRANQMAHYLTRHGVGPERLVGICLGRSPDMLVALLGIFKSGGAYVPLDPDDPEDRLAFMLEDSKASLILTERRFARLFRRHQPIVRCLDEEWAEVGRESREALVNRVKPQNLAYVIYTSGTTGGPKGVLIEHNSLVNYLCWFNQAEVSRNARLFPLVTKLTFDASLKQLFALLLRGDQIWILPEDAIREPSRLLKTLGARSGTGLNCVPTLWSALLDVIESGQNSMPGEALSVLLLGGEQISGSLANRTRAVFPRLQVWNLYGPTEATANTTAGRIILKRPSAFGKPIANVTVAILNAGLQAVPVGVAGEIYIGGAGLARGYLSRADLTAEKFIPDPFGKEPGARLFKTGDLARYLRDGRIEFLGRLDDQVKIRGFRIELGEIESTLNQHPGVQGSVAVVRKDSIGEGPLTAYMVPRRDRPVTVQELRGFLKRKLPDYMVPSAFVFLNALPRSANGKIDSKALPAPDPRAPELEENYAPPRTPIEELLCDIWAEVLKVDKVGIHDKFFDIGGHSLLATQVISSIRSAFEVDLALRTIFESPTVAELAERIEAAGRQGQGVQRPAMVAVSRDKDLPLSFSQERLWFVDQYQPNSSAYNIPSVLRLQGSLDIRALEQSFNEIIARHESLRTTFSAVDGEPVQVIAPSGGLRLEVVDLGDRGEEQREEEAQWIVDEECRRPFDLAHGPLFRGKLVRLGEDDHILVLTLHHIISDGWSMGVLYRELSVLYRAFAAGEPSPLGELAIQYADFALWQREWLRGEELDRQLSYWRKQLQGIPALLNLPTDRPRPAVQSHRGARQAFTLSKELTESLKALSRQQGVTLYMTLLAGFKVLLYRYTGQTDLVVGSPIAGRNRAETEGLIGFFVNTLVLRTDLSGNPSFREILTRVREVALAAYAHQELPFQKLVETLHPERDTNRRSLARAFFAFQNVPRHTLKIPALTVAPVRTDLGNAKGTLTLFMREVEGCLAGSLNYAVNLFSAATIGRMAEYFQKLLNALVADPKRRLLDLPPIQEQSRSELLEAIHSAIEQSWHFEGDESAGGDQGEI